MIKLWLESPKYKFQHRLSAAWRSFKEAAYDRFIMTDDTAVVINGADLYIFSISDTVTITAKVTMIVSWKVKQPSKWTYIVFHTPDSRRSECRKQEVRLDGKYFFFFLNVWCMFVSYWWLHKYDRLTEKRKKKVWWEWFYPHCNQKVVMECVD